MLRTVTVNLEDLTSLVDRQAAAQNGKAFPGDSAFIIARLLPRAGDDLVDPFEQSGWTYTCVDILAKNFSSVELGVFRGDRQDSELLEAGPFYDLFQRVNPRMSQAQALYAWTVQMKTGGESFFLLTDESGQPVARENEMPAMVWPIDGRYFKEKTGDEGMQVSAWELELGKKRLILEPFQVIRFAYYSTRRPHRGFGPMQAALGDIRGDFKAGIWNEALLENDSVPAGFFETAPGTELSPEQRKAIEETHKDEHAGFKKKGKIKILENLQFKEAGLKHKDMEWAAQRKWNRDTIFAIFRVPPFEAGLTEDVNRATAVASKSKLFEGAIIPDQKLFADTVNKRAEAWGEEWVWFDNSNVEALKSGFGEKLEQAERLVALGYPRDVVNARLDLGMEELAEGMGRLSTVPVGIQLLEEIADPLGVILNPAAPVADDDEEESAAALRGAKTSVTKAPAAWERLERMIYRPAERRISRLLRAHIRADRDETMKRLKAVDRRSLARTRSILASAGRVYCDVHGDLVSADGHDLKDIDFGDLDSILFGIDMSNKRLLRLMRPAYASTRDAILALIGEELGSLDVASATRRPIVDLMKTKELKVVSINRVTRNRIRAALMNGIADGETVTQLAKRLDKAFRGAASPARRLTIARTETGQVANGVRHRTYEMEGIAEHEWATAQDEFVRKTHVAQNGVRVAIGSPFPNGLLHPGDMNGPPKETIQCRCSAEAVT